MTQEEKFARIIELMSAEDELSEHQAAELDSLIDTAALRKMADEMERGTNFTTHLDNYAKFDAGKAFKKFKRNTQHRHRMIRRTIIYGAAAAVSIFLSVSGFKFIYGTNSGESEITAAYSHAMLITGEGERFDLSVGDTTFVTANSNAVIRDGKISFNNSDSSVMENRIVVPRGGIYSVQLEDGTRIMLNADSELVFPSHFTGGERRVSLRGEGYFEVTEDTSHPFIISTDNELGIRVLGTKFNVRAYDDLPMAQVTLLQGSVAVSLGESEEVLSPNQQAFIDHSSKVISVREVNNATSAAAWTHGWFDFEAATLTEIVSTLEKWYDVDISAPSIDLYSYGIFSMRMNCAGNIESILKMLNEVTGLRYKTDGNTILLIQ